MLSTAFDAASERAFINHLHSLVFSYLFTYHGVWHIGGVQYLVDLNFKSFFSIGPEYFDNISKIEEWTVAQSIKLAGLQKGLLVFNITFISWG